MNIIDEHVGDPEIIKELLSHGNSYTKSLEQETYNKYSNFKIIEMKEKSSNYDSKEITRDSFRWHTKDKSSTIDDMDGDFLLAAMTHASKHITDNFIKAEKAKKKAKFHESKMEYFHKHFEIMEEEFIKRYGIEVPDDPEGIKSMRTLIDRGTLKLPNFKK